jgi:hypothetical protein
LVVYTEASSGSIEDVGTGSSSYTVLDASQHLIKQVANWSGQEVVSLRPGEYSLRVETPGSRVFAVEVRIADKRTTEVHLDGPWRPQGADRQVLVFGPDGSPVGYRSESRP